MDAQLVADEIAVLLERKGSLKFKVIAYKMLQQIIKAGALGTEITLSGKLPSDRARRWRFAHGYLKKTGDSAKVVDRAQSQGRTQQGVIGVQVSILRPDVPLTDKIIVDGEMREKIKISSEKINEPIKEIIQTSPAKKIKKGTK